MNNLSAEPVGGRISDFYAGPTVPVAYMATARDLSACFFLDCLSTAVAQGHHNRTLTKMNFDEPGIRMLLKDLFGPIGMKTLKGLDGEPPSI
jgi:hypothetical protein